MQDRMLNCVVIGLGIGERHAQTLISHVKTRINAIIELDEKKILNFMQKYSQHTFRNTTFNESVLDPKNDLMIIASFDDHHAEQVLSSLKNHKHVFVEKPLCQNREQLEAIFQVWKIKQVGLCSNLILRKAPLFIWLKKFIAEGELGEIYAFEGDYLYGRMEKITLGWRSKVNNYSVMASGGIHLIDLMLYLTQQKPTAVQAYANKIATKNSAFQYADFHSANFYFSNGLHAKITANFGCMHPHQHVVKVFGTLGTFIYDDKGARLYRKRKENLPPAEIHYPAHADHKSMLLIDFIEALLNGKEKQYAMKEFDLMCLALAANEALLQTEPLKIEYLT